MAGRPANHRLPTRRPGDEHPPRLARFYRYGNGQLQVQPFTHEGQKVIPYPHTRPDGGITWKLLCPAGHYRPTRNERIVAALDLMATRGDMNQRILLDSRLSKGLSHGLCVRTGRFRQNRVVPHTRSAPVDLSTRTPEEWRQATEHARREARFKYAQDRIRRIVDGAPPLTQEQRDRLALILRTGRTPDDGEAA